MLATRSNNSVGALDLTKAVAWHNLAATPSHKHAQHNNAQDPSAALHWAHMANIICCRLQQYWRLEAGDQPLADLPSLFDADVVVGHLLHQRLTKFVGPPDRSVAHPPAHFPAQQSCCIAPVYVDDTALCFVPATPGRSGEQALQLLPHLV